MSIINRGQLFKIPVYTTATRNTLNAYVGLLIYNLTINKLQIWTGSTWETITSS